MTFNFELFGFCIDKDFDIKSFWIGAFTINEFDSSTEKEWTLLLIGKIQGQWGVEIFGKWLIGKETGGFGIRND